MQNPDEYPNPCDAIGDDTVPAKIWALLSRNRWFARVVARIQVLDQRQRMERFRGGRAAWEIAWWMNETIAKQNPFAGVALQWLVPDPLFHVRRWAIPEGCEIEGKGAVPLDLVLEGEGPTPAPADPSWRWGTSSQLNFAGRPMRRGPDIVRNEYPDERLRSKIDAFAEWENWPGRRLGFNLTTPWQDTPIGFRNHFVALWKAPEPYEATFFFQDWRLMDLVGRAQHAIWNANETLLREPEPALPTQREGFAIRRVPQFRLDLTETERARLLSFDDLAQSYRILAVPRHLLSRQELRRVLSQFAKDLTKELPDARQVMGTHRQWDDFLEVEAIKAKNNLNSEKEAILLHLRANYGSKSQSLLELRHSNETDVKRRVEYISGLCKGIFPAFPLAQLLIPMERRRGKK